MATDVGFTDGQDCNAATLNLALFAGGSKSKCKAIWARIRYNGSAWEVHATTDSAQLVSGNIAWVTDHIVLTLTGFTVAPVVEVTAVYQSGAGNTRMPAVSSVSSSQVLIYFLDMTATVDSVQSTKMDCMVLIVGV